MTYASEQNSRAIYGFDLGDGGMRENTLERARDSNQLAASKSLALQTATGGRRGFFVVLPIYRPHAPHGTVEERRANLIGFVQGVFKIDLLVDTILSGIKAPVDFVIYPSSIELTTEPLLVRFASTPVTPDLAVFATADRRWSGEVKVADLRWKLAAMPSLPPLGHPLHELAGPARRRPVAHGGRLGLRLVLGAAIHAAGLRPREGVRARPQRRADGHSQPARLRRATDGRLPGRAARLGGLHRPRSFQGHQRHAGSLDRRQAPAARRRAPQAGDPRAGHGCAIRRRRVCGPAGRRGRCRGPRQFCGEARRDARGALPHRRQRHHHHRDHRPDVLLEEGERARSAHDAGRHRALSGQGRRTQLLPPVRSASRREIPRARDYQRRHPPGHRPWGASTALPAAGRNRIRKPDRPRSGRPLVSPGARRRSAGGVHPDRRAHRGDHSARQVGVRGSLPAVQPNGARRASPRRRWR